MVKILHALAMAIALATSIGTMALQSSPGLGVMDLDSHRQTSISIQQSAILVTDGEGMKLEVVSLTGRRVVVVNIKSAAQRVELNIPKGCYILKIGNIVRKVSIR